MDTAGQELDAMLDRSLVPTFVNPNSPNFYTDASLERSLRMFYLFKNEIKADLDKTFYIVDTKQQCDNVEQDIVDSTCLYRIAHFLTGKDLQEKPTFNWFKSHLKDYLVIILNGPACIHVNHEQHVELPETFIMTQCHHAYLVTSDYNTAQEYSQHVLSKEIIDRVNGTCKEDFIGRICNQHSDKDQLQGNNLNHAEIIQFMKSQTTIRNEELILDHKLHRNKGGLYYLRQKENQHLYEIGSNRQSIRLSNSPDGACAYYSIFKLIKPCPIQEWVQLAMKFLDTLDSLEYDVKSFKTRILETWKDGKDELPFGQIMNSIYQTFKDIDQIQYMLINREQMSQFYHNFRDVVNSNAPAWIISQDSLIQAQDLQKQSGIILIHAPDYNHVISFSSSYSSQKKKDKFLDMRMVQNQVESWLSNIEYDDSVNVVVQKPKLGQLASIRQKSCFKQKRSNRDNKGKRWAQRVINNVNKSNVQQKNLNPINESQSTQNKINYQRRVKEKIIKQLLKQDVTDLPKFHETDSEVLKQIFDHRINSVSIKIIQLRSLYQRDALHYFYKCRSQRYELVRNDIVPIYKLKDIQYNGSNPMVISFIKETIISRLTLKTFKNHYQIFKKFLYVKMPKYLLLSFCTITFMYHLTASFYFQDLLSRHMPNHFPSRDASKINYGIQQKQVKCTLSEDMTQVIKHSINKPNVVHQLRGTLPHTKNTILKLELKQFYPRLISRQVPIELYSQIIDMLSYKKTCYDTTGQNDNYSSFSIQWTDRQLEIVVNQKGAIPPVGISYLRQFPLYKTSLKQSKEYISSHGGHPFGRYVNDVMHSHNLSLLKQQIDLKLKSGVMKASVVIPGSKFKSQMSIFNQIYGFDMCRNCESLDNLNTKVNKLQSLYGKMMMKEMSEIILNQQLCPVRFNLDSDNLFSNFNPGIMLWIRKFVQSYLDFVGNEPIDTQQAFVDILARSVSTFILNQRFVRLQFHQVTPQQYKELGTLLSDNYTDRQMMADLYIDFISNVLHSDDTGTMDNIAYGGVQVPRIDINNPTIDIFGHNQIVYQDPLEQLCRDRIQFNYIEPVNMTVYHIRPCDSPLDQDYYGSFVQKPNIQGPIFGFDSKIIIKRNIVHIIMKCTLQQFENCAHENIDYYLMNDVHYYLSDVKLKSEDALVYTSGTNHTFTPGSYRYYFGEGSFNVYIEDNIAHLKQLSRGQGRTYSHPVVHLREPSVAIPFGWWTAFSDCRKAKLFNQSLQTFVNIDIYPTDMSIQDTFLYVNSAFYQQPDPTLQRQLAEYRGNSFYRYDNNTLYPDQLGNNQIFGPIKGVFQPYDYETNFRVIQFRDRQQQEQYISDLTYSLKMQVDQRVPDPFLRQTLSSRQYIQMPWSDIIYSNKLYVDHPFIHQRKTHVDVCIKGYSQNNDNILTVSVDDQQLDQIMYNGVIPDRSQTISQRPDYSSLYIDNYYKCDLLGKEKRDGLLQPNPDVILDLQEYNTYGAPAALRLLEKLEREIGNGPLVYNRKKKQYEIFDNSKAKAIKTGFNIIDISEKAHSQYEFCTTLLQNKIAALYRQMSGAIPVDQNYFDTYVQVTNDLNQYITQQIAHNEDFQQWCDNFDIIQFFRDQDQWSTEKRLRYEVNTREQLLDQKSNLMTGSIMLNVKSGEVHTEGSDTDIPHVIDSSKRGRTYGCVSQQRAGALVALQQIAIKACKMVWKDFIHGMNKKKLLKRMRYQRRRFHQTRKFCRVISADGKAYDSTQYKNNQKHGELKFVKLLKPYFYRVLQNDYNRDLWKDRLIDDVWSQIIRSWDMEFDFGFMKMEEVNCDVWSDYVTQMFQRDFPQEYKSTNKRPWEHYVYIKFYGTTNSGKDLETTFGNTYRNLAYFYTYMRHHLISFRCWEDDRIFCMASGDDLLVMIFDKNIVQNVYEAFKASTSPESTTLIPTGMGQCIKVESLILGTVNNIEFCSKWFFSETQSLDDLDYCRDMKKLMTTKSHYTGRNIHIMRDASLHREAILQGIQSEKVSKLAEDMMQICVNRIRMNRPYNDKELRLISKHEAVRYATQNKDLQYGMENYVNNRLGLALSDFLSVYWNDKYIYNGSSVNSLQTIQTIHGIRTDSFRQQQTILKQDDDLYLHQQQLQRAQISQFENNLINQKNEQLMQTQKNKTRKYKNSNSSLLSDLSQILQDQRRHLADNKPIEQHEVDRLNLKSLEDRFNTFEKEVISIKQSLPDSDIKTIIRKLEEKDGEYLEALNQMKELMQPLRGMSRAAAIDAGVELQTWPQLQEMQRENKLVIPNMIIQNKVKAGLLPTEAGTGSGDDLRTLLQILQNEGVNVEQYREDLPTFRAILMMNDWRSIAKDLGQRMFSYASQNIGKGSVGKLLHAINPTIYEAIKTFSQELPKYVDYGADSGIWGGDQSSQHNVMDKKYTAPGFNEFSQGIPRNLVGSESMLSVDYNFLATFICPQSFGYREPQDYPLKTALIHNTQTLQLSTNANGEALFMINPDLPARHRVAEACQPQLIAPGESQSWSSFWAVDFSSLVATNSDLQTGTLLTYENDSTQTPFSGLKDGPLSDVRNQISQYKTTGFSVSIKPVQSELNNSGTIHFAYFPRSAIQAVHNNVEASPTQSLPPVQGQALGLNAIDTAPYHQQGNFKSGYRFNHIPHPQKYPKPQSEYSGFGDVDELYVIAATGCEPNAVVGSIEVSYVYEYIPVFTSQLMAIRNYPQLGSRSGDFASNMIQKYPAIMSMVEEDAYELASRIHRAKDNTAQGNEEILEKYFTRNH